MTAGVALAAATSMSAQALASSHLGYAATGRVVLTGRVMDSHGMTVPGAYVSVYAWPAQGSEKNTRVGQPVLVRLVGWARSGVSGRYTVRVSDPSALRASASSSGVVNLQASAAGPGGRGALFGFSVLLTGGSHSAPSLRSLIGGRSSPNPQAALLRLPGSVIGLPGTPRDFCEVEHITLVKIFKPEWGTIAEIFSRSTGIDGRLKYSKTQQTNFSLGESASGDAGTFSSDGTYSWSSTVSEINPWNKGPFKIAYQQQFVPAKYKITFSPGNCTSFYTTEVRSENGSERVVKLGTYPRAPFCSLRLPGQQVNITTTRALTFTAGLTVSEIGFAASAQTGYSVTAQVDYKDVANRRWHLCGVKGYITGHPGLIVAQR